MAEVPEVERVAAELGLSQEEKEEFLELVGLHLLSQVGSMLLHVKPRGFRGTRKPSIAQDRKDYETRLWSASLKAKEAMVKYLELKAARIEARGE